MKTRHFTAFRAVAFTLVLALSLPSCEVVDLNPISTLTEANFYKTAGDMDKAVLGVYSRYQSRLPRDWTLLEMSTDHLYMSSYRHIGGLEAISNLDFQPQNDIIRNFWQNSYNGIFRANAVLTYLDVPDDYTGTMKDQLEGEARFMRALFYFDLVRAFGGVPNVTTILSIEASRETPRASEEEIYSLIISDLEAAIEKLPARDGIARGRAAKGAAVALLGKVYVYLEDWEKANEYLKQVDDFGYRLIDDFASLWSLENEDNDEVIFAMKYIENENGHLLSSDFIPYFGVEGVASSGLEVALLAWSLHKKYEEADTRKAATVAEYWKAPGSAGPEEWRPYVKKFAVPHSGRTSSGIDLPVLRYADIVLLRAEALYHLDRPADALAELNKVRVRAFGNASRNYTLADISSPEDFLDKLLLERQLELAFENQRWFDLVRTGRFMEELDQVEWGYNKATGTAQVVDLNPQPHFEHFPIPQHEIDQASPGVLLQNEGY